MGYSTDFLGGFSINKPLSPKMKEFLTKFSESRRMKRTQTKEFGIEGEFFVDGGDNTSGSDVIDHNNSASTQPGLYCQWIPNEDGTIIIWDSNEKFYYYNEWLVYLIHKILAPNGYILNGEVVWQGQETGDVGTIIVENNKVFIEPFKKKRQEKTPKNCEKHKYPGGRVKNFMRTDVVFIIDKAEEPKKKKVSPKTSSKKKTVTIKIEGLKNDLDERQLKTLLKVVKQYSEGLVDKAQSECTIKQKKIEIKG